jgi:lipoteichoic acid synthase
VGRSVANRSYSLRGTRTWRLFTLLVLVTVLKLVLTQSLAGLGNPGGVALGSLSLALFSHLLIWLLPQRWIKPIAFLSGLLLSAVLVCDLVYYQFFRRFIPISALRLTGQITNVSSSVAAALKPAFFGLFFDIPLWVFWWHKADVQRLKPRQAAAAGLLCSFLLALDGTPQLVRDIRSGNSRSLHVQTQYGALRYHLHDWYATLLDGDRTTEVLEEYLQERTKPIRQTRPASFGLASERNLVVLQVEAMQNHALNRTYQGREVTPFLNSLLRDDSFYFERYLQMIGLGNTSDAEFISNTSYYAHADQPANSVYLNGLSYTLPVALRQAGYVSYYFHGHTKEYWLRDQAIPAYGFNELISSERLEMDEVIGIGLSDRSLFRQSLEWLAAETRPFYAFFSTLTSHHPYLLPDAERAAFPLADEDNNLFGQYLQSMSYADSAIAQFFSDMKDAGQYENSIFVLYGDHFAAWMSHPEARASGLRWLGKDEFSIFDLLGVPLIIHIPGMHQARSLSIVGGQIDLMPTLLNLLGIRVPRDAILLGQDLLNATESFIPFRAYTPENSFVTNELIFLTSPDGDLSKSRAYDVTTLEPIDPTPSYPLVERARLEFQLSHWLLTSPPAK